MKKNELIEHTNEIYNKLENAINFLDSAMYEVRSAFRIAELLPSEASGIENDSDGEDVAEPDRKK